MRCEFANDEWTAIRPVRPNKPRGVPRVNDRRVLNGIFYVLRAGRHGETGRPILVRIRRAASLRSLAACWRLGQIINALAAAHDAAVPMIDTSIVRVHQHGSCVTQFPARRVCSILRAAKALPAVERQN